MENKIVSPGEIITFYSYKGGVGRSMALANIACLLGRQQQSAKGKVLMIDWDLEAPGLHQFFHGKILSNSKNLPSEQLGLIDLFYEIKDRLDKYPSMEGNSDDLFMNFEKYFIKTNQPALYLMPAGSFTDGLYSSRVNQFEWADFFDKYPSVISHFAHYLRKKFQYILIDSRTGYSDISGICTSIMPEKLVTIFTPNRQSVSGIVGIIRKSVNYRKQSDDLRPLKIYPLPSRVDDGESKLKRIWRFGDVKQEIDGYQAQIEGALKEVYNLKKCELTVYFDEYQLQYVPIYSYGERIAVLSERSGDRLSIARSFEDFSKKITSSENSWDMPASLSHRAEEESEKKEKAIQQENRKKLRRRVSIFTYSILGILMVYYVLFSLITDPQPASGTMTMAQFFYSLLNSQYFGILAIIWIIVDLIWVGRWKNLIQRISQLLPKPWIFQHDENSNEPPIYPREFLEQLARTRKQQNIPQPATQPYTKDETPLAKWANAQRDRVFDANHPIRSLGAVIALGLFIFFLLADAITIANTMVLMGLVGDLSPLLLRLDLAILGGALLSAVVGVWMLIEMSGTKGELIDVEILTSTQKKILKMFSLVITLFSMAVMVALAVQRLISLGSLEATPTTDIILSFVLYGLLSINSSLAAALTFSPAASGLVVMIYLSIMLIIGILPIIAFLADVLGRVVYISIDIIIWALFTPIIAIPYGIGKVFGMVSE